jgi:hypothetical protein
VLGNLRYMHVTDSANADPTRWQEPIRSYLDPSYRYVLSRGPQAVRSREDAISGGLNCIALAHLLTRDLFGYELPESYQCTELSRDYEHFRTVPRPSMMRTGDLVWLGDATASTRVEDFVPRFENGTLANFAEYPINHVAIYTGVYDQADYQLIHANRLDGTNTVWPLAAFRAHARYSKIYAIMRLRRQYRRPDLSG